MQTPERGVSQPIAVGFPVPATRAGDPMAHLVSGAAALLWADTPPTRTNLSIYFCVKRRQVNWAEYLLLRAGVPVVSPVFNPRNPICASRYGPGSEPPTRSQKL